MSYWTDLSGREKLDIKEVVSRAEYREILLARMAGGDMDASATLSKIRRIDKALDAMRVKPIYTNEK